MFKNIFTAVFLYAFTMSSINANVCDDTKFNTGSIKEMDRIISACEKYKKEHKQTHTSEPKSARDISPKEIAVFQLVSIYPNEPKVKKEIIDNILKYAKMYNINPVTLSAVLAKESSMNKGAKHGSVYVKIPTKRNWVKFKSARVTAVGLGGVIYEIWKYELNDIGIKDRKSLYGIKDNIKATACILSIYTHERKQLRHTSSKEESALLRYYGVVRDKRGIPIKTYSRQVYKIKKSIKG